MCAFLATEVSHYFIECTVEKEKKKKVTELLWAATGQMWETLQSLSGGGCVVLMLPP